MDDDALITTSKVKGEATNKVKDGYIQLAEKMEQVRNQVAKMERKYDELYQTVKGKEQARSSSISSDTDSQEEDTSQRDSIDDSSISKPGTDSAVSAAVDSKEESSATRKISSVDIEKMENNPFL